MVIPWGGPATTPTFSTLPATLPAAFAFSCQRKPAPLSSASRNSLPETRSLRAALVAPIFGAARSRKSCNRSPRSFYNFPTTRSSIRATAKSPPSAASAPPIPFSINRRYSFSPPNSSLETSLMGQELACSVLSNGKSHRGKALLESNEILFRGDLRLKIPLVSIKKMEAGEGKLSVRTKDALYVFDLGPKAEE